jgi:hypothetical protein
MNGMFYPATAGYGIHIITYTVADANNCEGACTFTITVSGNIALEPPSHLKAIVDGNNVSLSWFSPDGGLIRWDDGNNYDSIGLSSGGTFSAAIRFVPSQLNSYTGWSLTKIAFFPTTNGQTQYVLKVWKGANAATLVVSQPIATVFPNIWNEIVLQSPVLITGTEQLWFGYQCINQPAGDYPASLDYGPAQPLYGEMILSGTTWLSLYNNYYINANWKISGWVSPPSSIKDGSEQRSLSRLSLDEPFVSEQISELSYLSSTTINKNEDSGDSKSTFNAYKIYRNGEVIATDVVQASFIDVNLNEGNYTYQVTALYNDGESPASNQSHVIVGESEIATSPLSVVDFVNPGEMKPSSVSLSNSGIDTLKYDVFIDYGSDRDISDLKKIVDVRQTSLKGNNLLIIPPDSIFSGSIADDCMDLYPAKPLVTDATWDVLFSFNCRANAQSGIETNGENIYTATWNVNGKFSKYSKTGVWLEDFTIPNCGAIKDMAFDGTYFYGGAGSNIIYVMDLANKLLVGTITTTVFIRHISFDPRANSGEGGFWCGTWRTMALVNRTGQVLQIVSDLPLMAMYGSAYDPWTSGGPYLWLFDQGGGAGTAQYIHQFDISTLSLTGLKYLTNNIPGFNNNTAGGLASSDLLLPGKFVMLADFQHTSNANLIGCYELDNIAYWLNIDQLSGKVNPGQTVDFGINFDASNLQSGRVDASLVFLNNSDSSPYSVPVSLLVGGSNQQILIPEGWSGFSTYQNALFADAPSMFAPIQDNLIIVQDFEHLYWPVLQTNTYSEWNPKVGAQIKMDNEEQLEIIGIPTTDKTINLGTNWYYLSVLSQCNVASASVFEPLGNNLKIVKDIAGSRVYWPQYGINTLNTLEPGKAYFIKMNNPGTITYQPCTKSEPPVPNAYRNENLTPWKSPSYSANSQIIVVPKEICQTIISSGDYLGGFAGDDLCNGFVQYQDENTALVVFGDDPTTPEKDGFAENDLIKLRVYNPESNKEADLSVTWDASLPQHDGLFHTNGISAIKGLEVGATGYHSISGDKILIFPNPAKDQLNIIVPELNGQVIKITNINGQHVYSGELLYRQTKIDISQFRKGVYFVQILSEKCNYVQKVVKD